MNQPPNVFWRAGGTYSGTDIPRGQMWQHLRNQRASWDSLPRPARDLATRALTGGLDDPGIGLASEFRLDRRPVRGAFRPPTERRRMAAVRLAWLAEQSSAEPAGLERQVGRGGAVQATRLELSIRTDSTVHTSQGVRGDWLAGEPVRGARAGRRSPEPPRTASPTRRESPGARRRAERARASGGRVRDGTAPGRG